MAPRLTRTATPEERLDMLLLAAITMRDGELAHIAEHVGMGEMAQLKGVNGNAIRQFFYKLTVARQLAILAELESCEW